MQLCALLGVILKTCKYHSSGSVTPILMIFTSRTLVLCFLSIPHFEPWLGTDARRWHLEANFSVLRRGLKESVVEATWKTTCCGSFGSVLVYGLNAVSKNNEPNERQQ